MLGDQALKLFQVGGKTTGPGQGRRLASAA